MQYNCIFHKCSYLKSLSFDDQPFFTVQSYVLSLYFEEKNSLCTLPNLSCHIQRFFKYAKPSYSSTNVKCTISNSLQQINFVPWDRSHWDPAQTIPNISKHTSKSKSPICFMILPFVGRYAICHLLVGLG